MMTVSSFDRCSLAAEGFRSNKLLRSWLCVRFLLGISFGSFLVFVPVVDAWSITVVPGISLRTAPLIGGPSWLPLHVKMVIFDPESPSLEYATLPPKQQEQEEEFRFDYVPLNPTSPETLQKLLLLQPVPAEARKSSSVFSKTATTSLTRRRVQRALEFCETYEKDLQLLSNNCWTFCFELLDHVQRDDDGTETDKKA